MPDDEDEKLVPADEPRGNMTVGEPEVLRFGATQAPTLDLKNRPRVTMPNGDIATVNSMGVGYDDGEYLIPTVSHEGTMMNPDEAIAYFKKTGEHMGVYPDIDTSNRAAEKLHLEQERMVNEDAPLQNMRALMQRKAQ